MTEQRRVLSPEEVWKQYDRMEARLSARLSERMLGLAGVRAGMRVLDLATGRGEPAIPAAHRVGPGGSVLGVDVSAEMLAFAKGLLNALPEEAQRAWEKDLVHEADALREGGVFRLCGITRIVVAPAARSPRMR
jgi:SAM-dependent methyltransferase